MLELISKIDQDEKIPGCLADFDFIMCNPPFFSNESEHLGISNIRKPNERPSPSSLNTGLLHESVHENGGEVAFIKQIIDESLKLKKRIKFV